MVRGTARDGEEPRVRETSRAFGPSLAPGTRGRRVGSPALVTRGTGGGRTASGASALGVPNPAGPPGREEEHLELEARRCAGSERSRPICSPLRPAPKGPGRLYTGLLPPGPPAPSRPGASRRGPALTLSQQEPEQPADQCRPSQHLHPGEPDYISHKAAGARRERQECACAGLGWWGEGRFQRDGRWWLPEWLPHFGGVVACQARS